MVIKRFVFAAVAFGALCFTSAQAAEHEVKMLNKGSNGQPMAFEPAFLKIAPGDTVKFVNADKGHNSEIIPGMVPAGGETWKGKINEEISVTLTKEGIYGYKCLPHYAMGMMGVIQVGNDTSNLEEAKKVKHPGKSRQVAEQVLAQAGK